MLEAKTDAEFRAAPQGGFVFGEGWLYFCLPRGIYGFTLWGAPTAEAMSALVAVLELELDRPPHQAFVDVRAIESITAPPFAALLSYVARHFATLSRVVERVAIARGDGLAGATVAGFMDVAASPFPATYCATPAAGLAALGLEPSEAAASARALEDARCHAAGAVPLVHALGSHLEGNLAEATIELASKALSLSTRTLQRRLADAGTSFAFELQNARIRMAQHLLATSDAPLTTIALEIGCASPQHFSSMFKKQTGTTPTAFRAALARR